MSISFFTTWPDLIDKLFDKSLTDILSGIAISFAINSLGFSKRCSATFPECLTRNSSPSSSFFSLFEREEFSFVTCLFFVSVGFFWPITFLLTRGTSFVFLTVLLTRVLLSVCFFLLSSSDFLNAVF